MIAFRSVCPNYAQRWDQKSKIVYIKIISLSTINIHSYFDIPFKKQPKYVNGILKIVDRMLD